MIVAFSLSPLTADEDGNVSEAIAAAVQVVRDSGLPRELNAMFTNVEGEIATKWYMDRGQNFRVVER